MQDAPRRAGVHLVKLPVTDLARSREWYHTRLGYRVQIQFFEQGQVMSYPGKETIEQHTGLDPHAVTTINDPRESAERRKQVAAASSRNEIT